MYEEDIALRVMTQAGTYVVRASSKLAEDVLAKYLAKRAMMSKEQQHQELLKNNPMEALVQRGIPVSMAMIRNEEDATKLITRCKNANINLYIQQDKEAAGDPNARVILVWDKNYDSLVQTLSLEVGVTPMSDEETLECLVNNLRNREDVNEPSEVEEVSVESEEINKAGEREEPILERKDNEVVNAAPENFPLSLNEKEMASRSEMPLMPSKEKQHKITPSVLEARILSFQEDSLISNTQLEKPVSEIPSQDSKMQAAQSDMTNIILMNPMEVVQNKKKGIYETMSDIRKEIAASSSGNEVPVIATLVQNLTERNEEVGNR